MEDKTVSTISIYNLLESMYADTKAQGESLYKEIMNMLNENGDIEMIKLDFDKMRVINSAFLNDSIGKLYSNKKESDKWRLSLINVPESVDILIREVIDNVKNFSR